MWISGTVTLSLQDETTLIGVQIEQLNMEVRSLREERVNLLETIATLTAG
jgi:hypothetical protein